MITKKLVLASKSPRRHDILSSLDIAVQVTPADVVESHPAASAPDEIVIMNARSKAQAVTAMCDGSYIIGADTIVYHDGDILIKPDNFQQAKEFLIRLSASAHSVYTGIVVIDSDTGRVEQGVSRTEVTFRSLPEKYIDLYIEKIHPYDKAGGYAIQGLGALVVERIDGCFFNVMGLPVHLLDDLLMRFGHSLFDYIKV